MNNAAHYFDGAVANRGRIDGPAGFILASVLWIIAIFALITTIIVAQVSDSLDRGFTMRAQVDALRHAEEAQAVALYWLTTRPMSNRGVEIVVGANLGAAQATDVFSPPVAGDSYIALDDRPYRYGGSSIRLQDNRGLIDINQANNDDWSRFLAKLGVAADNRAAMIAQLRSYIDRGGLLATPWELSRVAGWDQLDRFGFATSPIYEVLAAAGSRGFNLNTASAAVLGVLPTLDDDAISRLVATRVQQPFDTVAQAEIAGNAPVQSGLHQFYFLPADSIRLGITGHNAPLERVLALRLTPNAPDQPWQFDYSFDLPVFPDHHTAASADVSDFPDPAQISAQTGRG